MSYGDEEPRLGDLLRAFECSTCCSDRIAEDSDFKAASRPGNVWDHDEEPVDSIPGNPRLLNVFGELDGAQPVVQQNSATLSAWRGQLGTLGRTEDNDLEGLEERAEAEVEGGYSYAGQWKGQVRHGQGVLDRQDGVRYAGTFVDGQAHGRGIFTGADGSAYDGEWDHDQMHGYGKYIDVDGSTYEGEWSQDQKSGRGIECYADGARYEGEFWMGGKHGAGIYRSGAGVEYEGQYAHDKMDGEGRYKFADGRAYSGQWAVGHMQGFGKMSWPNGSRYEVATRMTKNMATAPLLGPMAACIAGSGGTVN